MRVSKEGNIEDNQRVCHREGILRTVKECVIGGNVEDSQRVCYSKEMLRTVKECVIGWKC